MAGQRRAPGGIGDRRQAEGRGGLQDGECRRCHWWGYRGTGWRRPATTAAAARQRHRCKHERRQLADRALVEYVHFIDKKYSALIIRQYFFNAKFLRRWNCGALVRPVADFELAAILHPACPCFSAPQ